MISSSPLVTVVIVSFNNASYISETLDSVLAQDYDNLEILIYDNGSKDNSVNLIKSHEIYKKSKCYFNTENLGLIPVLNNALEIAEGKYINFLAGDDRILFDKISFQVDFLEKNNNFYACSGSQIKINEQGMNLPLKDQKDIINSFIIADKDFLFNNTNVIYSPTSLYKKDVLIKLGGYDKNILIEDLYIYYKAAYSNFKLAIIPKVFTEYRIHSNNSHSKYERMVENKLKILDLYKSKSGYVELKRLIYLESFYILSKVNKKKALSIFFDTLYGVLKKPFDYKTLYFLSGVFYLLLRW